jgi:hypothetical protein
MRRTLESHIALNAGKARHFVALSCCRKPQLELSIK